ncbi:N-acetylmuramoyl-L-alanine amidase [Secundilactobacillus mixtipabuli]|uniref:N-acetylmuramoyl-L-alanine amidase n=1 Tax=Secundilactobacillus mixtipabuli TaxID=1435342 RepID=A0A1Z5IB04_9LACO|nr:N-acetylmuramoyl-L-alanine amidase [Secundilactobacillus mixtipabuli]
MKKFSLLLTGLLTLFTVGAANATTAHASSAVNNYISSSNIKPAKISSSIWGGFPKNAYRHGVGKPEGVVIHETANPSSTIYNEIAYMKAHYNNAFVHSFVDASHIINIANTNYLAWGVGFPGNARYVQFEQVEVHSKSAFAHEVSNAAWYTAYLLHQYGLTPNAADYDGKGTVWSHRAVAKYLGGSDHTDPVGYYSANGKKYFGSSYTMADFYQLVHSYYYDNFTGSASKPSSSSSATPLDKVTYSKLTATAKLSSQYANYRLYNHVKNAYANTSKYSWSSVKATAGKKVYVNDKGVKDKAGTTWYRFTFSTAKNAKQYWAYAGALDLN